MKRDTGCVADQDQGLTGAQKLTWIELGERNVEWRAMCSEATAGPSPVLSQTHVKIDAQGQSSLY